jgi:hypothetical protein
VAFGALGPFGWLGCQQIFGLDYATEVPAPTEGGVDSSLPPNDAPAEANDARTQDASAGLDASAAPDDGAPSDVFDAGIPIFTVAVGQDIDSILSDGTKIYWREGSSLPSDGSQQFYVQLKSCPITGKCAPGGDVLGGASSFLVFLSDRALALVGTTLVATTGQAVVSCDVGGCGGNLTTVYDGSGSGTITSLTAAGRTLLLARTGGSPDSRVLWACDIADCAHPTSLIYTAAAPGAPSLAAGFVAFRAAGIYACSISTGCPDGQAPIATYVGTVGGSLWNDGTNVYFTLTGTGVTDDAGNTTILNGTGTVARCGLAGCNGLPTSIATNLNQPTSILVDGTDVYWANSGSWDANGNPTGGGSIQRCSTTDGCKMIETITDVGYPSSLTVDSANIYWGDSVSGKIQGRAKH